VKQQCCALDPFAKRASALSLQGQWPRIGDHELDLGGEFPDFKSFASASDECQMNTPF
jgi:hypothetical protein